MKMQQNKRIFIKVQRLKTKVVRNKVKSGCKKGPVRSISLFENWLILPEVQISGGFEQFAINGKNDSAMLLGERQIKGVVNG